MGNDAIKANFSVCVLRILACTFCGKQINYLEEHLKVLAKLAACVVRNIIGHHSTTHVLTISEEKAVGNLLGNLRVLHGFSFFAAVVVSFPGRTLFFWHLNPEIFVRHATQLEL